MMSEYRFDKGDPDRVKGQVFMYANLPEGHTKPMRRSPERRVVYASYDIMDLHPWITLTPSKLSEAAQQRDAAASKNRIVFWQTNDLQIDDQAIYGLNPECPRSDDVVCVGETKDVTNAHMRIQGALGQYFNEYLMQQQTRKDPRIRRRFGVGGFPNEEEGIRKMVRDIRTNLMDAIEGSPHRYETVLDLLARNFFAPVGEKAGAVLQEMYHAVVVYGPNIPQKSMQTYARHFGLVIELEGHLLTQDYRAAAEVQKRILSLDHGLDRALIQSKMRSRVPNRNKEGK